jgi:hypothetical protein
MTEKEVLGFKPTTRLEQVGEEHPKCIRIASIATDDATILPHHANSGRMEFSERTGQKFRSYRRAAGKGAQKGAWVEIVIIGTHTLRAPVPIDSSIDTHQI